MSSRRLSNSNPLLACICIAVLMLLTACESDAERKLKSQSLAMEQWVLDNVKVGMTKDEVIQKMGSPDIDDTGDAKFPSMTYLETKSMNPFVGIKGGYGGCDIKFKDGKVTEVNIIKLEVDPL